MQVTVQQLRCFLAVAEELHFTRAAARLHVAPPSLSQQVAVLERQLRTQLFRRTSRRVELTEAGVRLLPPARRAVEAVDEVEAWAGHRTAGERLVVGVVAGGPLPSAVLSAAAGELPDVRWEVRSLGFAEGPDALRAGRVDVVLAPLTSAPRAVDLRAVPLWCEGRVLVVPAAHRLAGRADVGIDETTDERFVGVAADEATLDAWFVSPRPDGRRPRVDAVVQTLEEVLELCAAGMAVNLAGATVARGHARPDLRFVPVRDVPPVTVCLLRRADVTSPARDALEAAAHRVVRERAAEFGATPVPGT
ncbi:LysR family transcriptional regulator [Kineococcus sp. SYSU DK001]|uniref:LysR family transcriptional regulator n=1 Tax=Kineococcus sp. SYSU DK001 TaxID=3383122 RepID=UPI003D7ECFA9